MKSVLKKGISVLLSTCILLASCGQKEANSDSLSDLGAALSQSQDTTDQNTNDSDESNNPDAGAGSTGLSEETPTADPSAEKTQDEADKEGGDPWERPTILLSDQILKPGDTLTTLYPTNEDPLNQGLHVTLRTAGLYDSPAEAGLDKSQLLECTENYDLQEEPFWCYVDDARILVCEMTIENINQNPGGDSDLHITEFQVVYADPSAKEVHLLSCAPAYFSASSSQIGASDYYHYQLPVGESKDVTVVWLIPEEYALKDLYLCSQNDAESAAERHYFQLCE